MSTPARAVESISGWKKDLPAKLIKIFVREILVGVLQIFQKGESIQYRKKKIVERYVLTETCLGESRLLLSFCDLYSTVFVTCECFHHIFMISKEKLSTWYVKPNFLGGKKTKLLFSLGIFLNENSVAKSFADNTPCEETVGTGCQLVFS